MTHTYVYHRILAEPREWQATAAALTKLNLADGGLFGVWRSQIGRARDELTAVTFWPSRTSALQGKHIVERELPPVRSLESFVLSPTLRPVQPEPPQRQGNYAFRWFQLPAHHWPEFLELCTAAWPRFEASYDSQVVGLWRMNGGENGQVDSLLLTRRPNLAMWERSKIPEGEAETEVRQQLSRRYDLCDSTYVYTTTLITAADSADEVRWT